MKSNVNTVFKGTDREFTGSLREIMKHFNIPTGTFYKRLSKVDSIEEVIDWNRGSHSKITVFVGTNREFTGYKQEIAEHFGTTISNLNKRIRKYNLTLEQAIDYKPSKEFIVFKDTDREFAGNISSIAKHFNVAIDTLNYRIETIGLTLEEAIDYKNTNYDLTVFKGTSKEFTGSKREIADYFHLNSGTFISRTNRGYSLEEAIEIPTNRVIQYNLTYKNEKGSMKELCEKFNKNYIEVYNKVKYMKTFKYAMDSTIKPYGEQLNG